MSIKRSSFLSSKTTKRSLSLSLSSKLNTNNIPTTSSICYVDQRLNWSTMIPELLRDIIERIESTQDVWPHRRDIVSCACVCKRWRDVTKEVVKWSERRNAGRITFPESLKQPGPRDAVVHCFIKRNKKNSTYSLYLDFNKTAVNKGKFLLAAKRIRHGAHTEHIISVDADDLSQGSNAYVGKLSSDFISTKFTIYDSQAPHIDSKPSSCRSSRRFASKQISPQVPAGSFEIGQVSYKFNLLKLRGPRRMLCTVKCPWWTSEIAASTTSLISTPDQDLKKLGLNKNMILRNNAPRWHGNLQCWCLNFHGRVTVASVKNFQLVVKCGQDVQETVLLQFGKVGENVFTMDYLYPLSAFQAFAICLTSFGTKLACE